MSLTNPTEGRLSALLDFVTDPERRFAVYQGIWVLVVVGSVCWLFDYNHRAGDWQALDPMSLHTHGTAIIGVICSLIVDRNQVKLVRRLRSIGVIDIEEEKFPKISHRLRKISMVCQFILLFFFFFGTLTVLNSVGKLGLTEGAAAALLTYSVVGFRIGRMLATSLTVLVIFSEIKSFRLMIDHPDSSGGVDFIGRFHVKQGGVFIFPVGLLLYWLWTLTQWGIQYDVWRPHLIGLLITFVIFATFIVLLPLQKYRKHIVSWKREYLEPIVNRTLSEISQTTDQKSSVNQTKQKTVYLASMDSLPDWPLSAATVRYIWTVLLIPLLATFITVMFTS